MSLQTYLPQDRRRALAHGVALPNRAHGSALFADIHGFTRLTEQLHRLFGKRRGAEEVTKHLDAVYEALIGVVEQYDGSVVSFAGDAIICWFDDVDSPAAPRAVACGLALQEAVHALTSLAIATDIRISLNIKISVATGPVRRFVVGDPDICYMDTLAGATIARMATAERMAVKGELLVDEATVQVLNGRLTIKAWRAAANGSVRFAVVTALRAAASFRQPMRQEVPLTADRLKAWVHTAVYRREQSGHSSLLSQFRPCVALFIRFSGIDYDSDAAETQLDRFIRQTQAAATHYGGTLLNHR